MEVSGVCVDLTHDIISPNATCLFTGSIKQLSLSLLLPVGCPWLHFHRWSGHFPVSPASMSFLSSSNPDLTTELIMRLRAAEEP